MEIEWAQQGGGRLAAGGGGAAVGDGGVGSLDWSGMFKRRNGDGRPGPRLCLGVESWGVDMKVCKFLQLLLVMTNDGAHLQAKAKFWGLLVNKEKGYKKEV